MLSSAKAVNTFLVTDSRLLIFFGLPLALIFGTFFAGFHYDMVHMHIPGIPKYLGWFVDDIGMVTFFVLVVIHSTISLLPGGDLHGKRKFPLPIIAALFGAIVPALIVNKGPWEETVTIAWAIVMATDIVLARYFGTKVFGAFASIIGILLTMAIADDLYGLVVLFYKTGDPAGLYWLSLCLSASLLTFVMNKRLRVRNWLFYFIPLVISWVGLYQSGAHPTLASIFVVPLLPFVNETLHRPAQYHHLLHIGQTAKNTILDMEHALRIPVEYVVFVFIIFNAAVDLKTVFSPSELTLVVMAGFLIGKPLGIIGGAYLAMLFGVRLPDGVSHKQFIIGAPLMGIGMTVAFFFTNITYEDQTLREGARLGAFLSAIISVAEVFVLAKVFKIKPLNEPHHRTEVFESFEVTTNVHRESELAYAHSDVSSR